MEQYQAAITKLDAIDVAGAWGQPQLLLRVDLERKDNMTWCDCPDANRR
jgi:hypothetical protein